MAKPITYIPEPVPQDTAQDELNRLVEVLHERGVLRLLTNLSAESHGVAQVALEQLDSPQGKNLIGNLFVLLEVSSKLEDGALEKLMTGVVKGVNVAASSSQRDSPPGTFGLVRELNDPDVRRGLSALLTLLGTLGRHLKETR